MKKGFPVDRIGYRIVSLVNKVDTIAAPPSENAPDIDRQIVGWIGKGRQSSREVVFAIRATLKVTVPTGVVYPGSQRQSRRNRDVLNQSSVNEAVVPSFDYHLRFKRRLGSLV